MIRELRTHFNREYNDEKYAALRQLLDDRSGAKVEFRIAETPLFVPKSLLQQMADEGRALSSRLIADPHYLSAARRAIPQGYSVQNETPHPHFLTADFALVRDGSGELTPRLVEIQAFPSVFGYQALLCSAYREIYGLSDTLGNFLSGLNEESYWELLARTVLASHDPENVVLTEVDPWHQKTLPDFTCTAKRLGIAIVDIAELQAMGDKLHYKNARGQLVPIHRIYNRAIVDELIARGIRLPFDLTLSWDVEWAGHPNWYFLISKFSVPWLSGPGASNDIVPNQIVPDQIVPPAVFLSEFLEGEGRAKLAAAGVPLPADRGPDVVYTELLLKPLFSFAGKGIQFEPTQRQLEAVPIEQRAGYLLQQKLSFVPTIDTPHGLTQAEFRILYMWPDGERLTPALSLVRLGRGKMMGVDHNKNQAWVGASAAFFPRQ
ncbi:MAG: hypothetical protein WB679_21800 [Terracidiphilus sp.]